MLHIKISFAWIGGLALGVLMLIQTTLHAQTAAVNPFQLTAHHATVSVADLDKECQWYQQVLGFREVRPTKVEAAREVRYLGIPGYRLDFVRMNGSARHLLTPGPLEQGWLNLVFKTADIEGFNQHLNNLNISVKVDKTKQGTIEHLTFFDPEGNEIGVAP